MVGVAIASGVAAATLSTAAVDATAAGQMSSTPRGRVLVLNQNLREFNRTWNDDILGRRAGDMEAHRELGNFARRVARRLNRAPDVIVTQETGKKTLSIVARKLRGTTGRPYAAVVQPRKLYPRGRHADPLVARNTGVIINSSTMRFLRGGYLRAYMRDENINSEGIRRLVDQAWALLEERRSGMNVLVMAIHFPPREFFRDYDATYYRTTVWARRVIRFVKTNFPNVDVVALGGEWNKRRCHHYPERVDCRTTDWWNRLINAGYRDAVLNAHMTDDGIQAHSIAVGWGLEGYDGPKWKRIDFIFAKHVIFSAGRDMRYNQLRLHPRFISDHRWDTAVVGKRPTVLRSTIWRKRKVHVTGSVSGPEAGSNVTVELLRKRNGRFRLLARKIEALDEMRDFSTSFRRRGWGTCRITVRYPGNASVLGSKERKTFSC